MFRSMLSSAAVAAAVVLCSPLVLAAGAVDRGAQDTAPARGAQVREAPVPKAEMRSAPPPARETPPSRAPDSPASAAPPTKPPAATVDCSAGSQCFEEKQAARQHRYDRQQRAAVRARGCAPDVCSRCGAGEVCSADTRCTCQGMSPADASKH